MKVFLPFLIVLLFLGCGSAKPQAYPQWYKNRELQSAVKYEIIGYGQGKTIKEAESVAKEDIAQTLISKIDSTFTSISADAKSTNHSNLKITSKLNLQNVKSVKQEYMNNIFYIALKYKNLDLASRIKTTIGEIECTQNRANFYLSQTPLVKKLTASIGCELDFKLDRRNEAWYLKHKEYLFLLSEQEFEELYVSKTDDKFAFISNSKVLTDGDSFYFTFNSKQAGYITLLNVYENGIVTLLQPSLPINKTMHIPSKDSKNYFEAGLVKENIDTYDLYVAIFTKEPLDMSRFEYASEDLAESELAYKFDELIGLINRYNYSSILLRTKAK